MVYYYNHPVKVFTKIFLALFWPFFDQFFSVLTQKLTFWPIYPNQLKRFCYFCIFKLLSWFIIRIKQWKFWQKTFHTFLALFYPNLSVLTPKNVILAHFSHSAHRILLLFHIKTIFMVFYYDYLKFWEKYVLPFFWPVFDQKMSNLTQKLTFWTISPYLS